jgi:endogenous inhibitor of DNA gyrase (YacG/DUF329 family)
MNRKELKCHYCGKLFWRRNSMIRCKNNYCSKRCVREAQIKGIIRRKRTYLTCKQCEKEFYGGSLLKKFCSHRCYFKWFRGKNASNWQGGISSEYDKFKQSKEWKKWRIAVFTRDNYTCQICRFRNGQGEHRDLHPHHLVSASKYPEFRLCIDNGLTVCVKCHGEIHSMNFRNRKY